MENTRRGARGNINHRNKKRLSKTEIGIPQDFVHVATVKSPTKIDVNFNDTLISDFLQKAEVSSAALCDPETQRVIKDFIEKVGIDAIRREINSATYAQQIPQINIEQENENFAEKDLTSTQNLSKDSTSIVFSSEHDIDITSEIDDVFAEPDSSPALPTSEHDSIQASVTEELKLSPGINECVSPLQLESEELPISPNPDETDQAKGSTSSGGRKKKNRKKNDHDKFLHELQEAIKKRNARMKKRAENEMKKSEEGWSEWNSPTKSKSYVSFFQLDSPPLKPTRTIHTVWDLTSDSHYVCENEVNDDEESEPKDLDCTDSKKLASHKPKIPLTKGTGAITKIASSEELVYQALLSSSGEDFKKSKSSISTAVNEEEKIVIETFNPDESNQEGILDKSGNEPVSIATNEGMCQTGESDDAKIAKETEHNTEIVLNKQKSSQAKNKSWFGRRNHVNKSEKKTIPSEVPSEVKKTASSEQGIDNDFERNGTSVNKEEKKQSHSIFSSLTKKKVREELPNQTIAGGEQSNSEEDKVQSKSKTTTSSKFRLFGSSEKLIDHGKGKQEAKKQELSEANKELQTKVPSQNKESSNKDGKTESSGETTSSENFVELTDDEKTQELTMENHEPNTEKDVNNDEISNKEDANISSNKTKSSGMMHFLFASGKISKQKMEEKKEESSMETEPPTDTTAVENISKDDKDPSMNKKRSGIINLLFAPPEKHVKLKHDKKKQDLMNELHSVISAQKEESSFKEEPELTMSEQQESSMLKEESNTAKDIPKNEFSDEEEKSKSANKTKSSSMMNLLFASGKLSKQKLEVKKEEASMEKEELANTTVEESICEEDKNLSLSKKRSSGIINFLFAPHEKHAKPKHEMKNQDSMEELPTIAVPQIEERSCKEEKEISMNKTESSTETTSTENVAELKDEVKQQESSMVKEESMVIPHNEESNCKEDTEHSTNETGAFTENTENSVELKEGLKQQEPCMEMQESNTEKDVNADEIINKKDTNISPNKNKSSAIMTFLFASGKISKLKLEEKKEESSMEKTQVTNVTVEESTCDEDKNLSLNKKRSSGIINFLFAPPEKHIKPKHGVKNDDITGKEEIPAIVVTQTEERSCKEEQKIIVYKTESIASTENFVELKDEIELQEQSMVKEELHTIITPQNEDSSSKEDTQLSLYKTGSFTETAENFVELKVEVKQQENPMENQETNTNSFAPVVEITNKEDKNISPNKTKSSGMMNFLFSSGKISKQKLEMKKEESSMEKTPVTNVTVEESTCDEDKNLSLNKKRSSGIINFLFAPPEKHIKPKHGVKNDDITRKEEIPAIVVTQTEESSCKEEQEIIVNKTESIASTEKFVELKDEVELQEQSMVKEELHTIITPQNEDSSSKEDTELSLHKTGSFTETAENFVEIKVEVKQQENPMENQETNTNKDATGVEITNKEDKNISPNKTKSSGMMNFLFSSGKISKQKLEVKNEDSSLEKAQVTNVTVEESTCDEDKNLSLNKKRSSGIINFLFAPPEKHIKPKDVVKNDDITGKEEIPAIVVTQTEESSCKEEQEIIVNKTESIASTENFIELKDEVELLEQSMVKEELHTIITPQNEDSSSKEDTELSLHKTGSFTETAEDFVELKDEVKQQENSMENQETNTKKDATSVEITNKEDKNISSNKPKSSGMMNFLFSSGKISKQKLEVKKEESSMEEKEQQLVNITVEEKICEENKNLSLNKKRSSGIINLLFAPPEKHTKQRKEVKKQDLMVNEELSTMLMAQSDESRCKEDEEIAMNETVTFTERNSCENIFELTDEIKQEEPSMQKQDLPINTASGNEELDPEKEKNESLDRTTSSSKMHSLFGSSGKRSKQKKNVKQPTAKKEKEELPSEVAANEDSNSKEEKTSSLSKTGSSSMINILFGSSGKHTKLKHEGKEDLPISTAPNNEAPTEKHVKLKHDKKKQDLMNELHSVISAQKEESSFKEDTELTMSEQQESSMLKEESNPAKPPNNEEINDKNLSVNDREYSGEISSVLTPEKGAEQKDEMKKQEDPMMVPEIQEATQDSNEQTQHEVQKDLPTRKIPSSRKTGFFSLPDRRAKMKHEAKQREASMVVEESQNATSGSNEKDNKEEEKHPSTSKSKTPRKKGLFSSLDKRQKVKHEARNQQESLEKEENPNSDPADNVESISKEEENPSLSGAETSTKVKEVFPPESAFDNEKIKNEDMSASKGEPFTKSSSYPRRRAKPKRELKKEDICVQKDLRHRTHITWDPIKHNFVLHHTDDEYLRKILLEDKHCEEAAVSRQRRHSYSMAMDDPDVEIIEDIPRASVQSYSSVTSNTTFSRGTKKKMPIPRPRSEIIKVPKPVTEL